MVDFVWVDCVEKYGGDGWCGAYVPARVALQGAHSSLKSPHTMRMFLVWKRRYADVRAGTQAPPLRFRLGGLRVGWLVSFGWIACKWYFVCVGLRGKILRSVVGAVPVCPPVSPHKGASIVHSHAQCVCFWHRNAAARTFGRARRRRPYGFVWVVVHGLAYWSLFTQKREVS